MHILILGAGALGSLIGARLSQGGAQVSLLTTDRPHVRAVSERGLIVDELNGTQSHYSLPAYHDPLDLPERPDLIVVTVKSHDTRPAVNSLTNCAHGSTIFLTLQNGIGNWEQIAQLQGEKTVLAGTTAQGATLIEPGVIRHGGNGPTSIGEFEGPPTQRVQEVVDLFRQANLETQASDQMQRLMWEKLLINVGINAITALTGVLNGWIAEIEPARALSRDAVKEALMVARSKGFHISDSILDRVIAVAEATSRNRSSMGQDVDSGKRTEIDAINGAIVRFGEQVHIPTPVNNALTRLVQIVDARHLAKEGE